MMRSKGKVCNTFGTLLILFEEMEQQGQVVCSFPYLTEIEGNKVHFHTKDESQVAKVFPVFLE